MQSRRSHIHGKFKCNISSLCIVLLLMYHDVRSYRIRNYEFMKELAKHQSAKIVRKKNPSSNTG